MDEEIPGLIFSENMEKYSVVELAKQLVSLDSQRPDGTESKVSQFIFDHLKSLGLKPEKQFYDEKENRFNVLVFGSETATVMINVHIDTVSINDPKNWKHDPFG